jgi:hypothetical protein
MLKSAFISCFLLTSSYAASEETLNVKNILQSGITCDGYELPYLKIERIDDHLVISQRIFPEESLRAQLDFEPRYLYAVVPLKNCKKKVDYYSECSSSGPVPFRFQSARGDTKTVNAKYILTLMSPHGSVQGKIAAWGDFQFGPQSYGSHSSEYPALNCHLGM